MDVAELEEILQEFMQAFQLLLDSGETITDEFYGMAAQTLENIFSRLDEVEKQQPATAITPETGIPPADAQLLWILAGQQEQAFLSYLRNYPSAQTEKLLNSPLELSRVIDWLTTNMPSGQPANINGIDHADLNSSNIWGSNYDPKTGKMMVRFQSGAEYEYEGIPANIYRAFIKGNAAARTYGRNQYGRWWVGKNPSLGAAMNQYIKAGNFPYRRIR